MLRILVVEDIPVLRNTISRLLARSGAEVLLAGDGAEALEVCRAEKERLSMVFLDLGLPEIGGQQVWETLCGEGFGVPVVVMSGEDEAVVPAPAGYLRKPFLPPALQSAVERHARLLPGG